MIFFSFSISNPVETASSNRTSETHRSRELRVPSGVPQGQVAKAPWWLHLHSCPSVAEPVPRPVPYEQVSTQQASRCQHHPGSRSVLTFRALWHYGVSAGLTDVSSGTGLGGLSFFFFFGNKIIQHQGLPREKATGNDPLLGPRDFRGDPGPAECSAPSSFPAVPQGGPSIIP